MSMPTKKHSKRGFASMDKATQRAIASKGGKIAHETGKAHEFSAVEARVAGRKGGKAYRKTENLLEEVIDDA